MPTKLFSLVLVLMVCVTLVEGRRFTKHCARKGVSCSTRTNCCAGLGCLASTRKCVPRGDANVEDEAADAVLTFLQRLSEEYGS